MNKAITIRDLSDIVGMSPAAVSLALSGKRGISEKSREMIRSAAAKHGYRPNPLVAAALAAASSKRLHRMEAILAVVTPFNLRDDSLPQSTPRQFWEGMESRAAGLGFSMEQFVVSPKQPAALLERMLKARNISGVVLHELMEPPAGFSAPEHYAWVVIGVPSREHIFDSVCNDHAQTIRLAVTHLEQLGYHRIGLALNIGRPEHFEPNMLGEFLALTHMGHTGLVAPLVETKWTEAGLMRWVAKERPDAVISNDHGALSWLKKTKRTKPVAFAHTDLDVRWAGMAGVDQCNFETGQTAVELLAANLNANRFGPPQVARFIRLQGRWVDGASAPAVARFERARA